MPNPLPLEQAYDPEKAQALAEAWVDETINGEDGDFGDGEFLKLRDRLIHNDNSLAAYTWRGGPEINLCQTSDACGFAPGFGRPQQCDSARGWMRDERGALNSAHHMLENVALAGRSKMLGKRPMGGCAGSCGMRPAGSCGMVGGCKCAPGACKCGKNTMLKVIVVLILLALVYYMIVQKNE